MSWGTVGLRPVRRHSGGVRRESCHITHGSLEFGREGWERAARPLGRQISSGDGDEHHGSLL